MTDPAQGGPDRSLIDYVEETQDSPSPGFAEWVQRSVAHEPIPRRGPLALLTLLLTASGLRRLAAQAVVVAAVVVIGIGSAMAIGHFTGRPPGGPVDSSPSLTPVVEPDRSPRPEPTPTEVAPSPTPTEAESPSASDEPRPSESDAGEEEAETPEPSESS